MTSKLQTSAISVHFEGLVALDDVSLELAQGEICGLIGPNGAGKTTLINVLTRHQRMDRGDILVDGLSISNMSPERISKVGISRTFQAGRLFGAMSVSENAEVAAVAAGLSRKHAKEAALSVLDWMGLYPYRSERADTLPYAFERRVGIARALAGAPKYVLLDEPAAGMSDVESRNLVDLVRQIPTRFRAGVLLIEHNMRVISEVCDRVHVLDGGRTLAQGDPATILRSDVVINAYIGRRMGAGSNA